MRLDPPLVGATLADRSELCRSQSRQAPRRKAIFDPTLGISDPVDPSLSDPASVPTGTRFLRSRRSSRVKQAARAAILNGATVRLKPPRHLCAAFDRFGGPAAHIEEGGAGFRMLSPISGRYQWEQPPPVKPHLRVGC